MISRSNFEELLANEPQVSRRWLTNVSQRLARSHSRLTGLLGHILEFQIAHLLLQEQVDNVVSLPQTTVAALLWVRRQSVYRVLRAFARDGLIEISYGRVRILDAPALVDFIAA